MSSIFIGLFIITIYFFIIKKSKALALGIFAISLTYDFNLKISNINIYLFDIFYIALLLNLVLLILLRKKKYVIPMPQRRLRNWSLLYFYWLLLSFLIGVVFINDITASLNNLISLIRYIQVISIFILVMSYKLKIEEIKYTFKLIYLNSIIIAIYGIIQTYIINSISYNLQVWFGRTYSVFNLTGPNAFSIYISFFILVSICIIIDKRINFKYRFLNFIFLLILIYPFVYTFSRTGYIALFIASAFLLYLKNKIYVPIYFLIVGIIIMNNNLIYDRLISYTLSEGLDVSSIGRLEYWKAAYQTILQYPISGVGFNGFSIVGTRYTNFFDSSLINVHNEYLQIMLNSGLVGFLLFISLLILLFSKGFKLKKQLKDIFLSNIVSIYLSSIILLAISSFFFSPFLNFQIVGQFWLVSAVVLKLEEERM